MNFNEAWDAMQQGKKVKLPGWAGYWAWENGTIMMHCKDGKVLDIRETEIPEYTFGNVASEDFILADEENTPILGGTAVFSFSDALRYLKRGLKVKRQGWNGKNQYIELAYNISYQNAAGEIINSEHDAIGNKAIAFVGTSGVQMGWLASQSDMLAEDWIFVD